MIQDIQEIINKAKEEREAKLMELVQECFSIWFGDKGVLDQQFRDRNGIKLEAQDYSVQEGLDRTTVYGFRVDCREFHPLVYVFSNTGKIEMQKDFERFHCTFEETFQASKEAIRQDRDKYIGYYNIIY